MAEWLRRQGSPQRGKANEVRQLLATVTSAEEKRRIIDESGISSRHTLTRLRREAGLLPRKNWRERSPRRDQVNTLLDQGYTQEQILRMGYSRSTVTEAASRRRQDGEKVTMGRRGPRQGSRRRT